MSAKVRTGICFAPSSRRTGSILVGLFETWRQRRMLERLDRAALDDIGISPHEARREARRPIWDVPGHWHR